MRRELSALALSLAVGVAACGGGGFDARLEPLANAPLEVGRGLGDLVLGETTLGQVVDRYGHGQTSLLAGDEAGFEVSLAGGQLDLLFMIPTEWYLNGAPLKDGVRDLTTFVKSRPEYGDLTLASLSVSVSRFRSDVFYQGSLDRGGRLGGSIDEVLAAYGEPPDAPGLFVAGMSPNNSEERALYPALGLQVHYRSPEREEPEDEDAEEGAEEAEQAEEEPEPALIESIALFLTNAP